jgi:hypothetical protein
MRGHFSPGIFPDLFMLPAIAGQLGDLAMLCRRESVKRS